jgi:hypothetical protein
LFGAKSQILNFGVQNNSKLEGAHRQGVFDLTFLAGPPDPRPEKTSSSGHSPIRFAWYILQVDELWEERRVP